MRNKVGVRIFGRSYTIAGEMEEQDILDIAQLVDNRMRDIARTTGSGSQSDVATLAAVNIAGEIKSLRKEIEELKNITEQLTADNKHYIALWDEAKAKVNKSDTTAGDLKALQARYDDLESNYFELQMENVQLKNRLERG